MLTLRLRRRRISAGGFSGPVTRIRIIVENTCVQWVGKFNLIYCGMSLPEMRWSFERETEFSRYEHFIEELKIPVCFHLK